MFANGVRNLLSIFCCSRSSSRSALILRKPLRAEIFPTGIFSLDQPYFLLTSPLLDFLLPRNRHAYITEQFVVHQPKSPVMRCESGSKDRAMLRHAALQVACHARIEVSRSAGEDINVVCAAHPLIVRGQDKKRTADSSHAHNAAGSE